MVKRKTKVWIISGLIVLGIVVWGLLGSAGSPLATVNVTTEGQTTIWIAHNSDEFEPVGQSKFTFSSKTAGLLAVMVTDGSLVAKTIVSLVLGQVQDVHLVVQHPKQIKYYTPGAISDPLITDNFVHGINNNTSDLTTSRRVDEVFPEVSFLKLPKVSRVSWFDEYNFIYSSRDKRTVGVVADGALSVLEGAYRGFGVRGEDVFLLSKNGVERLTFKENTPAERLWFFEGDPLAGQIFVGNQYTYVTILDEEDSLSDPHSRSDSYTPLSLLNVYSHRGDLTQQLAVPSANYLQILEVEGLVFLVAHDHFMAFDLETTDRLFEFELNDSVVDVLEYNESVYALTLDNGLWRLDLSQPQAGYHLLAHQPPNQTSVENSLVIKDNHLYFSSKTKPEALETATLAELSSVYYIELDSD